MTEVANVPKLFWLLLGFSLTVINGIVGWLIKRYISLWFKSFIQKLEELTTGQNAIKEEAKKGRKVLHKKMDKKFTEMTDKIHNLANNHVALQATCDERHKDGK